MRIYFIGAHSTGKTTLARFVADRYKLPFLNEVARTILAEKELSIDALRTNLDVVNTYQSSVFKRQLAEEAKEKSFVSDRSFDCLAYAAQHSEVLSDIMNHHELQIYIDSLRGPDSLIFFVRPSKETMKQDGVRETLNWEGVIAIDAMIKFLVNMYRIPCIHIHTSSMQERVQIITSSLLLAGMHQS